MIDSQGVAVEEVPPTAVPRIPRSKTHIWVVLGVLLFILLATIGLQFLGGAYTSEFGGYPDEPAHFTTGLMIRDYVAAGFPASPIAYAEDYYFHYPKVAFGMWGPMLHFLEASWTLIFPPNRTSLLVLMALISATTATLLFFSLAEEIPWALALLAALWFICIPTVQSYTGMIMADGLVALFDACAAFTFGRYLDTPRTKYAIWFGVFTCLSVLTKGNGVALVLLPVFAMAVTGKLALLKQRSLWVAAALILCIGGPWQYYSARVLSGILRREAVWTYLPFYTRTIVSILGWALLPVILVGLYRKFLRPAYERKLNGKWASAAGLIFSVWLFHSWIPAADGEDRYLIAVLPPLLMFLMAGVETIANRLPVHRLPVAFRISALAAVIIMIYFATNFRIPHKLYHGFDEVADLLELPEYGQSEIMVSSNGNGEGMLISEMAMREKRPTHVILRASKMLANSDWNGQQYKTAFRNPEQLIGYLKEIGVAVVVIDNDPGQIGFAHHALLKQAVSAFPTEWKSLGAYPRHRRADLPANIEVYRLRTVPDSRRAKIRIEMPHTLGYGIER